MFVDKVKVNVVAGKGGNGVISFRHQIFRPKGGPDGGDGGKGGDVILQASNNQDTLASFRYNKLLKAADGKNGAKERKHGKSAQDLIVKVPVGTVVLDEKNKTIVDLIKDGKKQVIAIGGKGGFGNAHFTSSVRQAPRVAEKGEQGEQLTCTLELRMIADVGLIGLPNAGKSSFLAAVSNAHPEIADYPFTTLEPNLGAVDINKKTLILADIPGLIEGASKGKGLGDEFLRHVSRTRVLLHLIDINSNDVVSDYKTIRSELKAYSSEMSKKPEIVALTKIETLPPDLVKMQADTLKKVLSPKSVMLQISSYANKGLKEAIYELSSIVNKQKNKKPKTKSAKKLPVIKLKSTEDSWKVKKEKESFVITGKKIEKFAKRTDFSSDSGIRRLKDIMAKLGIIYELNRRGVSNNDEIVFGEPPIGKIKY
jgi:GTP-binding protein